MLKRFSIAYFYIFISFNRTGLLRLQLKISTMKTENSPYKLELTYGIYFALISIVVNLLVWATALMEKGGLMTTFLISLFQLGILVGFLLICTKSYRDKVLNGKITFGQAFLFALIIVIFSSIITGFYAYVFNKFIDPEYTSRIMQALQDKTYQFMANQGVPDEQIEEAMVKFEEQTPQSAVETMFSALTSGLIGGSIISLITSAIVKKNTGNRDDFEDAMSGLKSEE